MKASKTEITVLLVILFGLTSMFLVLAFLGFFLGPSEPHEYGVIMDVSSKGIEFNLYSWTNKDRIKHTAKVDKRSTHVCDLNLNDYSGSDPSLKKELYNCLSAVSGEISNFQIANASIFIYGTDYTRYYCMKFPEICANRFSILSEAVTSFGMNVVKSEVHPLNSSQESLFGWISVNDHFDALKKAKSEKLASLDLKNYSFLISSEHSNSLKDVIPPKVESAKTTLYGQSYEVATLDLMCFGMEQAHNRLMADLILKSDPVFEKITYPCLTESRTFRVVTSSLWSPCVKRPIQKKLKDQYTIIGKPNKKECQVLIENVIKAIDSEQGEILEKTKQWLEQIPNQFYGYSEISTVAQNLGIPENSTFKDFCQATERMWENRKPSALLFEANYISNLLCEKLGLASRKSLIGNKVEEVETMTGSMVLNSKDVRARQCGCFLGPVGMGSLLLTSATFLLFGIFLLVRARAYLKRKIDQ